MNQLTQVEKLITQQLKTVPLRISDHIRKASTSDIAVLSFSGSFMSQPQLSTSSAPIIQVETLQWLLQIATSKIRSTAHIYELVTGVRNSLIGKRCGNLASGLYEISSNYVGLTENWLVYELTIGCSIKHQFVQSVVYV